MSSALGRHHFILLIVIEDSFTCAFEAMQSLVMSSLLLT